MLYLYPSNRLEDLAVLLAEVIKTRPKNILSPTTILVPNPGMQHWLNMQLCEHMGISMNINCPMPTRYIWDLCRNLLGDDKVPKKSPYKREVLTWKILNLCYSKDCKETDFYEEIAAYWDKSKTETEKQQRIFTFAMQLADLFEQYLVFRDEWIINWQGSIVQGFASARYQKFEKWQMWFWNKLVQWTPTHPVQLQKSALEALENKYSRLPEDIYIFAMNTMSPIYLSFFDSISKYTNVHLFQLNPCINYWGDAQSDIAIAKQQRQQALAASLDEDKLNPLLRNLGSQGRDLNNMLVNMDHHEIAAFSMETDLSNRGQSRSSTVLNTLQQNILTGTPEKVTKEYDGSLSVHACHSEVRELQVLKDVLLQKFIEFPDLKPKDILVMCPSIESYSPYISSVFTQSDNMNLNIPVSISDRKPIESEPYIVAFVSLLGLPNTRFDAASIIDLISLPALANKYTLSPQDIDMCAMWLKDAAIDWGKDSQQLEQQLGTQVNDNQNTWSWGLSRLLVGMCNASDESIVDEVSPVSYIEGQNTVTLGRFMQALEALEIVVQSLSGSKDSTTWASLLIFISEECLLADESDKFAKKLIKEAIATFQNNTMLANFGMSVELPIVFDAIQNLLSIPEVRSQFHTGNVTFCSMLPMRSIPFKIIAILGLNQKDFPRQDNPVEIDLMQAFSPKLGDRSRRGDDRYLFLESLVSARQYLHLSFQHRNIKNNSAREPSLVLKMLIDYCHQYYSKEALPIVEHALHPFGNDNFQVKNGYEGSFDSGWFACLQSIQQQDLANESMQITKDTTSRKNSNEHDTQITENPSEVINTRELISFLKGSLKYFANNVLNLYLDKPAVRDFEPIYQIKGLTDYKLRSQIETLLKVSANSDSINDEKNNITLTDKWKHLSKSWQLSGELPFLIGLEKDLNNIFTDVLVLQESIPKSKLKQAKGQLKVKNVVIDYNFTYDLVYGLNNIKLNYKKPSLSHLIELWIHYLILLIHVRDDDEYQIEKQQCVAELAIQDLPLFAAHLHFIKKPEDSTDPRKISIHQVSLRDDVDVHECLSNIIDVFLLGNKQPLLLDLNLAIDIVNLESLESASLSSVLKAKWDNCSRTSSDGLGFFPHTYFDYLLTDMPDFTSKHIEPYFKCFGAMQHKELPAKKIKVSPQILLELEKQLQMFTSEKSFKEKT